MPKKFLLFLAASAALTFAVQGVALAESKTYRSSNRATVYSTGPSNLPADVPYTNKRDRDWLGGYLDNNGYDNGDNIDGAPSRRDKRSKWRRHHSSHDD